MARKALDFQTAIEVFYRANWAYQVVHFRVEWASLFSRAFAELADNGFLSRIHERIISEHYENRLVGHNSRDSTAIEAREKTAKKASPKQKIKK